jgi:hypothetical protein
VVLPNMHVPHRRGDRGVAHQFLDRHHVHPQLGAPAAEGVTQVVESTLARYAGLCPRWCLRNRGNPIRVTFDPYAGHVLCCSGG